MTMLPSLSLLRPLAAVMTQTITATTTYFVTATNELGCVSDAAQVVARLFPPAIANAGADKVLTCATTEIALSGSSTTPGATFAWVASGGGHIVSGANTATPTVDAAGTYTLTVTNPDGGCTATDVALVTLNNTPPNVNAGADKILTCTTTSIALEGSLNDTRSNLCMGSQRRRAYSIRSKYGHTNS